MDLDKNRNRIEDRTDGGSYSFRVKSLLYIGDCVRELTETFKDINKNLEKIANNTEKQVYTTGYAHVGPLRPLEGKMYGPTKKDLDLGPITILNSTPECNIGKDIVLGPVHNNYGIES